MRRPIFLCLIVLSCTGQVSEFSKQDVITSLEIRLDSINDWNPSRGDEMADSLLALDPNNHIATITKAYSAFNAKRSDEALEYFKIITSWEDYLAIHILMKGWSYEREGFFDSAALCYTDVIPKIDSTWQSPIGPPHLLTVTKGQKEGLENLEEKAQELPELYYLQIKNDIQTYEGGGLSEFMPTFFVGENDDEEFYVKIPDHLFDNGTINSMEKVKLVFARMGINIHVRSTDSANKGYKIGTSAKYLPKLLSTDTLGLKRL